MRLPARIRTALRGPRPPDPGERWASYLAEVEPALAARPRVHRFAMPPVEGRPDMEADAVGFWVEGDDRPLAQALGRRGGDWLVLMESGTELSPVALERLGQAVLLAPDADVITCDEDELDADGARRAPSFRPGPSPDRWLACDSGSQTLLVRRAAAGRALAHMSGDRAWRHELLLRLAGPAGERAAHVPLLLAHRRPQRLREPLAVDVVRSLLASRGSAAGVQATGRIRRVRWPVAGEPEIEVIVCLRDRAELLRRCVDSLLARTSYERLRVALVDNGSSEAETLDLLGLYEHDPRIRVLHDPRSFNFAALNNAAARSSDAEVLVFLNNDTEVVDSDWAATLLEEAMRPEVGAVAPMLVYPDGAVQHAGAALGLHGYAGHPFAGLRPDQDTPFGRADGGTRNWLAVTAACMMVQRAKFEAVGGFDDSFVVAGNDVDLCLRLTAAGHRSLCVPHTTLVHDESRSRGAHIDPADFVRSEQSYGSFRTMGDPFYNPNLTLQSTDCGVRVPGEGQG